jgi:hypothetical protein
MVDECRGCRGGLNQRYSYLLLPKKIEPKISYTVELCDAYVADIVMKMGSVYRDNPPVARGKGRIADRAAASRVSCIPASEVGAF